MTALRTWLEHPLTRGVPLDDPRTTVLRRQVIRQKPFLQRLYAEWFRQLRDALPAVEGPILELGSGATDLRTVIPGVIRSEVFRCPGIELVADARKLPFASRSLRAIALVDVMHHIPKVDRFFSEAARCVRPGGAIVAIEPWVTAWSTFVYQRFHHEPFDPARADWSLPSGGPLSGANGALPWIALQRDRERFAREFPEWDIATVRPLMPVSYLLSGGVSMRNLLPGWAYPLVRSAEALFNPWASALGMFALIVLKRAGGSPVALLRARPRVPIAGEADQSVSKNPADTSPRH
jgi:SAM-dependent methyltransferase